jgi:hypothetical protein
MLVRKNLSELVLYFSRNLLYDLFYNGNITFNKILRQISII